MTRALLDNRDMRLLAGAVGLSAMGDWLALAPLGLHLADTTGSGFALAALMASLWAPSVLLAGPAGRIADRFESRAIVIWVSLGQALAAGALVFADSTAAILALTTLIGTGFALAQPAEFALVPAVLRSSGGADDERQLSAANGLVEFMRYAGFTLGPALGGLLAAAGSAKLALLVNAVTFVAVAVAGVMLHTRRRPRAGAIESAERQEGGLRILFADRSLAIVMAVAFFSLLFMTSNWAAMPFFVEDDLGGGEIGYGILLSCWTLGMAIGALGVAPRVGAAAMVTIALGATALQGAGLGAPALLVAMPLALVTFLVGGTAHGLKNTLVRTLIHVRVPDQQRGRAFASYNALRNGSELLALLGGAVMVSLVGARWTVAAAGVLSMAVGLAGLAIYRRRRAAAPAEPGWGATLPGEAAA
jgi:MFS family permease